MSATVAAVTVDGPAFEATIVYVTDDPGTAVVAPSVLVITRSAVGLSTSMSVAVLLPETGSVMPAPTDAVAVLVNEPVAPAATEALTVNVAVPPTGRSTLALMLPLPDAGHVAPPAVEHVHVAPVSVAGKVSVTFEAGAAEGPAFETTTVYVTGVPGTSVADPSVLVIDRSARGVNESVSVAELLAPLGSLLPTGAAMVAVLTSEPVAAAETVPLTVKVAVPETSRLTLELMLPLPDAGQLDPALAVHVHVTPVKLAGKVSVTVAPTITDGPAFDATIV